MHHLNFLSPIYVVTRCDEVAIWSRKALVFFFFFFFFLPAFFEFQSFFPCLSFAFSKSYLIFKVILNF
jgi:hypothetical protein